MSSYISSNQNRFYVASETSYGSVPEISSANRIPAVKLGIVQKVEQGQRRDKTGGRTFTGVPTGARRQTTFDLRTYLTGWVNMSAEPGYGPLFQAAMGGTSRQHEGGTIESVSSGSTVRFTGTHGLDLGQCICVGGELRFVSAIIDQSTVEVNAPFTSPSAAGAIATPTMTYALGQELGSISVFDYWSPAEAIQRVLCGGGVDQMTITVNSDYHQFDFRGVARDVVDSATFETGQGELAEFPEEPADDGFVVSIVPGHLGQAWLGSAPDRFFTVTAAELKLRNAIDMRNREFGVEGPSAVVGGQRTVTTDFQLYATDASDSRALYEAARQRQPISVMFQLGTQPGQIFGALLKSVVLEVPAFNDSETRLQWNFSSCRAQGSSDDELMVAFG